MASHRRVARQRPRPYIAVLLAVVLGPALAYCFGYGETCTRLSFDECEQAFQEDVMALFGHEASRRQEAWCDVLQDHEACLEAVLQSCREEGHEELSARIGRALSDVVRKGCAMPESWSAADSGDLHHSYALSDGDDDPDVTGLGDHQRPASSLGQAVNGRPAPAASEATGAGWGAERRWPVGETLSARSAGGRASRSRARPASAASEERQPPPQQHRQPTGGGANGGEHRATVAEPDGADGSLSELLRQLRGLTRDMKHLYRKLPPAAPKDWPAS